MVVKAECDGLAIRVALDLQWHHVLSRHAEIGPSPTATALVAAECPDFERGDRLLLSVNQNDAIDGHVHFQADRRPMVALLLGRCTSHYCKTK